MAADAPSVAATGRVLNINVGIMGHVDAGKTSLVRALSTELSTASLDKHPQSQERGITLDLGFSAFATEAPKQVTDAGFSHLQFTLVDCPGHASLIRTIIGGAQIIDMMILVIDIVKGIQTQTAECLVIGEIATDNMIVVLNKVDMLPVEGRAAAIERISGKIRKVLQSTKFAHAPFVVMSAAAGGGGKMGAAAPLAPADGGGKRQDASVGDLVALMRQRVVVPRRNAGGPFLFAVDHCFPIKGQGTVLTGTVLSGSCRVNDSVELPEVGQERKIKSMQMFRKPATQISQGDRAGICMPGLESSLLERGIACTPGAVPTINAAIALVRKIRFYKGDSASGSKFHVTVGHHTVMATAVFFGALEMAREKVGSASADTADGKRKTAATVAETGAAGAGTAADADAEAAAIVDEFSSTASGRGAGLEAVAEAALPAAVPAAAAPAAGAGGAVAAPRAALKALASASGSKAAPLGTAGVPVSEPVRALGEAIARRTAELGVPATAYDWCREYIWQDQLMGGRAGGGRATTVPGADAATGAGGGAAAAGCKAVSAAASAASSKDDEALVYEWQWAALLFETPVQAPLSALVIGSRLDADIHAPTCRLAFFGRLAEPLPSADVHELARCGLYKRKLKQGVVDRVEARGEAAGGKPHALAAIGGNLFSKSADVANLFVGLRVHTACGQEGVVESAFGKTGKFRLAFADLRRCNVEAAALAAAQDARLAISFPSSLAAAVADWNAGRSVVGADAALPLRASASLRAPSTPVYITLEAPPVVKPGAQIFLRYRKYQYAQKEDATKIAGGKPKFGALVQ